MNTQNPDIKRALEEIASRRAQYKLYADYYNGVQRLAFASAKFRNVFGKVFDSLALNVCAPVVEGLTDRLQVRGFGVGGGPTDKEGARIGEVAAEIWGHNRMAQGAGEVHQEAAIEGDAYLIVWPDEEGQPVFYPNEAHLMTVRYDPERRGKIRWGAKMWSDDDGGVRLNLYYADRIEKYRSRSRVTGRAHMGESGVTGAPAASFQPYQVEGEEWPLANPYGQVPVFHFANNSRIGRFGRSELNAVVPVQDAINKTLSDMLVGMETQALPQRWISGIEVPTDPETGRPINIWSAEPGSVWVINQLEAKAGQFDPADIEKFLKAKDSLKLDVAVITGTPLHYMQLVTDPPSGEALKTAEARHVKKVADRQIAFGNVWEDAMSFALRVLGHEGVKLQAQWEDPAPVSRLALLNELVLAQELESQVLLQKAGFSEEESRLILEARSRLGQSLLSSFTNGPGAEGR